MLLAGTADGVYRVTLSHGAADATTEQVLAVPRAERVRQFAPIDGVFAATEAGLYYSTGGEDWTDLGVPTDPVWALTISPNGGQIFAGTVPAKIYRATLPSEFDDIDVLEWNECDGFRALPSSDEWGVPRHNNQARVRDLCMHPGSPDRVIAGVEPGGVHVSDDRGTTWEERRDGVHDDIHRLHCLGDGEIAAATGVGLYHTRDAGQSWTRLDNSVEQRYFRTVTAYDGSLYASGACVPPSNRWETAEANPRLFTFDPVGTPTPVETPCPDAVIVGWTTVEDTLVGVTHRGTILTRTDDAWQIAGEIPHAASIPGCYYNLVSVSSA